MTSHGTERAGSAPEGDGAEAAWEDPLTRLLLLLEIAQRPPWLRDISRPAHGAASRAAG